MTDKHIISSGATVAEALAKLNALSGGVMTLVVADSDGKAQGTVTDGDIRRALIAGHGIGDTVTEVMNRSFRSLRPGATPQEIARIRACGIKLLPELDDDGKLIGLFDFTAATNRLPVSALLMAGGKGERLRPLTLDTPKPLLPVGGRPIIDYNIARLARAGITDVTVSVRYLADMIKSYFANPCHSINVKTIEETEPLGTIGAASLLRRDPEGYTLVMNSDLLTDLSLEEFYFRHSAEGADVTIAAIPYTVSVPYAILDTEGDTSRVAGMAEKPVYTYFANAGIYLFANRVLDRIPRNTRMDAPDLIEEVIRSGGKVIYHPINGTWIDIGTPADYRHACEMMNFHHPAES